MALKVNNSSRAEKTIAIIDNSGDENERVIHIRKLGSLKVKTIRIYKYLENLLISDSSILVRAEAAKWLISNFNEKGKTPLFWAIEHEKSCLFFKILLDVLENKNESFSKVIEKKILRKLSSIYDLCEEEAKFIFDVEFQRLNYPKYEPELGELLEEISRDSIELYQKKDGRIFTLNLGGLPIPESIGNLSELKYLNLRHKGLKSLPKSIMKLKNLKKLNLRYNQLTDLPYWLKNFNDLIEIDLSENQFESLPNWLSDLPKLKRINLYGNRLKSAPECIVKIAKEHYAPLHIKKGVIPSEALILGILDILLGDTFIKLSDKQFLHPNKGGFSHCYKMNDEGHIIALYYALSGGEAIFLLEFPEQIYDLQYLEELYIRYHKITKFPESIVRLKNLRIFDFKAWPNIVKHIPKSVIPFLLNLEKFECDGGIIIELIDIKRTQKIRDINIKYRQWHMSCLPSPIEKINSKNEGPAYDILLVDDDLQTIKLLQSFFEMKGYILKGAVSGYGCLEKLQLERFNPNILYKPKIILMDIVLSDMSGYLVFKKIRESELYNDSLIYFLTARPKYEVEMKVKECGADGYILKPFDFSDFNIILESLND